MHAASEFTTLAVKNARETDRPVWGARLANVQRRGLEVRRQVRRMEQMYKMQFAERPNNGTEWSSLNVLVCGASIPILIQTNSDKNWFWISVKMRKNAKNFFDVHQINISVFPHFDVHSSSEGSACFTLCLKGGLWILQQTRGTHATFMLLYQHIDLMTFISYFIRLSELTFLDISRSLPRVWTIEGVRHPRSDLRRRSWADRLDDRQVIDQVTTGWPPKSATSHWVARSAGCTEKSRVI